MAGANHTLPLQCTSIIEMCASKVKLRKDGILAPYDFCRGFIAQVARLRYQRDISPECWDACLDVVPKDLLEELDRYFNEHVQPIGYRPDPVPDFFMGTIEEDARKKLVQEIHDILQRVHRLVLSRLEKR